MGEPSAAFHTKASARKLLELPSSVLDLIFDEFYDHDLAQLCQVSKAARDHASAKLYLGLNHIFGLRRPRRNGTEVDDLAAFLETLATSDYNYARHIRQVIFDTVQEGKLGEHSCLEYTYEHSSGKFLQSLILAILKRAEIVERFEWNVRLEISPLVYQLLHRMQTVRRLYVRMQVGPSLHSPIKSDLPSTGISASTASMWANAANQPVQIQQTHGAATNYATHSRSTTNAVRRLPVMQHKSQAKTFSGFRDLTNLAVLDMDTLECVPEIAECIRNCSKTLKSLELSISDKYARRARKTGEDEPLSEPQISEDDISEVLTVPSPPITVTGFEAVPVPKPPETSQALRLAQEGALARIFEAAAPKHADMTLRTAAGQIIAQGDHEMSTLLKKQKTMAEDEKFLQAIAEIARRDKERNLDSTNRALSPELHTKLEQATFQYMSGCKTSGKQVAGKSKPIVKAVKKSPPKNALKTHKPPQSAAAQKPGQTAMFVQGPWGKQYGSPKNVGLPKHNGPGTTSSNSSEAYSWTPYQTGPVSYTNTSSYTAGPSMSSPKSVYPLVSKPTTMTPNGHNYDFSNGMPQNIALSPKMSSAPYSNIDHVINIPPKQPISNSTKSSTSGSATPSNASGCSSTPVNVIKPAENSPQIFYDDDIDLEHPDELEEIDEEEEQLIPNDDTQHTKLLTNIFSGESSPLSTAISQLEQRSDMADASSGMSFATDKQSNGDIKLGEVGSATESKGKAVVRDSNLIETIDEDDAMTTYIRLAHGLPLENLAIHLLPVKPSVLLRHIDFYSVKYLTLLNVGPQRTLWATLAKLNRQSPLPLTTVCSDNVTPSLLAFLGNLPEAQLKVLYMLEHVPKPRVPQLHGCAKTTVTIDEIAKTVLKHHMKSLRRLVIRNDCDDGWAMDTPTIRLIAREGQKLEELGLQCFSEQFHKLAQALPQLPKLYALHVVYITDVLQSANTITGTVTASTLAHGPHHYSNHQQTQLEVNKHVLEEIRASVVDSLSHVPKSELTYLGLSVVNGQITSANNGMGPVHLYVSRIYREYEVVKEIGEDETGGEEGQEEKAKELAIYTEDNLLMSDVAGKVRMWEKERWAGKI